MSPVQSSAAADERSSKMIYHPSEFAFVLTLMESTMKSILRSLAVLAVVVGFAGSSFAQDNNNDIIRPITKQGSAAFLFTINGLGTFGVGTASLAPGLDNAGFGMKYFISDDFALRILLGFNSSSKDSSAQSPTPTSNTMFGIGIGGEYHFRPLYSTSPYVGAQLGFQSGSNSTGEGSAESVHSTTAIGFSALAGFDWFFTRGIAIGAEYALGLVTRSGSTNPPGDGDDIDDAGTTDIGFGSQGSGNVHLVVYF
jgi:opacity protein-like surface antigen